MNAGDSDATYGRSNGPQDGQFRSIPTEAVPGGAVGQPGRTEIDARREARRKRMNGLLAASGGLATVVFLVLGFTMGAWYWAWVVFLLPGILRTYLGASE